MAICLLSPERAALSQPSLATGGLAQHLGAASADNDGLGMREDGGDGEAAGALDIHEEGARCGNELLEIVLVVRRIEREDTSQPKDRLGILTDGNAKLKVETGIAYLELVLAALSSWAGVEKVECENLWWRSLAASSN